MTKNEDLTLDCESGLYDALVSVAEDAGVSVEYAFRASQYHFVDCAAEAFIANPYDQKFREQTMDEIRAALRPAMHEEETEDDTVSNRVLPFPERDRPIRKLTSRDQDDLLDMVNWDIKQASVQKTHIYCEEMGLAPIDVCNEALALYLDTFALSELEAAGEDGRVGKSTLEKFRDAS